MAERIQVRFSIDGQLPDDVVLASIHTPGRGWFCITPGGVAHGPYSGTFALKLARGWVNDFLRPGRVDWDFCTRKAARVVGGGDPNA